VRLSLLFPEAASTAAWHVDLLYFFLLAVAGFFSTLIAVLIIYFAVKYRRRSPHEIGAKPQSNLLLEATWTAVPLFITLIVFVWGASIFFANTHPPEGTLDIYVVGKQWMWKFQHLDGQREIDELHIPVDRDVRIIATSEDVIHDFFVPAFRVKTDVVPGRYVTLWFHATKPGRYRLFCAEYCGTKHSGMTGEVVVMQPQDYQAWLSGGQLQETLTDTGARLFEAFACNTCHRADTQGRGPALEGVFGTEVRLQSGERVIADEGYVRESILNPRAKVVAGYQPIMPTFQGQVSEEQLLALVEYVKSLHGGKAGQ
jgi:cytochrome c oxidase subunit 2